MGQQDWKRLGPVVWKVVSTKRGLLVGGSLARRAFVVSVIPPRVLENTSSSADVALGVGVCGRALLVEWRPSDA